MYIYRCVYMSLVKIVGTNGFLVHIWCIFCTVCTFPEQ
jgi:hypothetical protein